MSNAVRLLIVEDERLEREGLFRLFDWWQLGIGTVQTANDGVEGLEAALCFKPDIIITDIKMPGISGIEMLKRIAEKNQPVKSIILSGYGEFDFAREALRIGVYEYLLKPIDPQEVKSVLERLVAQCKKEQGQSIADETQRHLEEVHDEPRNAEEQIVTQALNIIRERYMDDLSVKTIAAEIYLSPNYLGVLFKKHTGQTISDYLCAYRLDRARQFFSSRRSKVAAVAKDVGFHNVSYFCSLFKEAYGRTPREYQRFISNRASGKQ